MKTKFQKHYQKALTATLAFLMMFVMIPQTHAASLASMSDTMTRLRISTASNHEIHFQNITAVSSGTIVINFNTAGFTSGSTAFGDIDLQYGSSSAQVYGSCSSSCTAATLAAAAGATNTWGATFSTNNLTFAYPTGGAVAIAANDYVNIKIGTNAATGGAGVNQITNPGTVGSKNITITTPSDTGTLAVPIAQAPSNDDQVVVSASVDATITFSLSGTTASLGTMTTGAVATAPDVTLTMGTNAGGGYTVTIADQGGGGSPGLYKAAAPTKLIATGSAVLVAGTEGYGVKGVSGTGSPTIAAPFLTAGADQVGALTLAGGNFVTYGYPTGAINQTAIVRVKAAISASTPAGSYADTLTLIMTGNF